MKLLGSSQNKGATTSVDSLIGRQTEILGDVRFSGGLYLDGRVKGAIVACSEKAATLSISETGSIEGDVKVPVVVLNGSVNGDVWATERLTLGGKARVVGNVYYRVLQMEPGALINGQLVHISGEGLPPPVALSDQRSPPPELPDGRIENLSLPESGEIEY